MCAVQTLVIPSVVQKHRGPLCAPHERPLTTFVNIPTVYRALCVPAKIVLLAIIARHSKGLQLSCVTHIKWIIPLIALKCPRTCVLNVLAPRRLYS